MTAGPLTLEDMERLEQREREKISRAHLFRDEWERRTDAEELLRLLAAFRSVMADAEGLRDALMVAERMVESREKEANEARAELRSVMADRDAWRTQRDAFKLSRDTAREAEDRAVRERDEAREQVRSLQAEVDHEHQCWHALKERHTEREAEVRSLTAERDRALLVRAAEKSAKVAAFERLSLAREALEKVPHPLDGDNPCASWLRALDGSGRPWPCDCPLAALRAILVEPGETP